MRVRRVVDLSVPLGPETMVYPGDPAPVLSPALTIAEHGFNVLDVHVGSQSGTHVDAPYHVEADGERVDGLDLRLFVGSAVVVDARGHGAREPIRWTTIEPFADRLAGGPGVSPMVLLHTGWSRHYGTPAYLDHPYLEATACERLLDLGVRTILLDAINLDETPDDTHPGVGYPCHHLVAGVGGAIGENLCHLDRIDFEDVFVSAVPIKLTGADGAWVRAVAMALE